jgi:hypothetical protein
MWQYVWDRPFVLFLCALLVLILTIAIILVLLGL